MATCETEILILTEWINVEVSFNTEVRWFRLLLFSFLNLLFKNHAVLLLCVF